MKQEKKEAMRQKFLAKRENRMKKNVKSRSGVRKPKAGKRVSFNV